MMQHSQIGERVVAVDILRSKVLDHPMCAKFEEDTARFRVIYPCGMFPEGVQASYGGGKAVALSRMLDAMERHWKANGVHT